MLYREISALQNFPDTSSNFCSLVACMRCGVKLHRRSFTGFTRIDGRDNQRDAKNRGLTKALPEWLFFLHVNRTSPCVGCSLFYPTDDRSQTFERLAYRQELKIVSFRHAMVRDKDISRARPPPPLRTTQGKYMEPSGGLISLLHECECCNLVSFIGRKQQKHQGETLQGLGERKSSY